GLGISSVENGFPLGVASGRNVHLRFLAKIHLHPRTPVAIWIVDVATARQQFDIARSAKFGAAPARKDFGVEHIALVGAIALRTWAKKKNLAEVAAGGIEAAAGRFGEPGDLRGRSFQQVGKLILAFDAENVSPVSSAGEQFVMGIE